MMSCALKFAERSTCARIKAGAVIALDNHIISTGYNGNASGQEHCWDKFNTEWLIGHSHEYDISELGQGFEEYITTEEFKNKHREWAIEHELHAEMNSIIWAARRGISVYGGTIYTTYSPCLFCTKSLIHAGIKRVVYNKLYDRPEGISSIEILKENKIKVEELELKC